MSTEHSMKKNKKLFFKETYFTMIVGKLYKLGPNEILRRYVLNHERSMILIEAHVGIVGGHYSGKPTK